MGNDLDEFCKVCDNYKPEGCSLGKGYSVSCNNALVYGKMVTLKRDVILFKGVEFMRTPEGLSNLKICIESKVKKSHPPL